MLKEAFEHIGQEYLIASKEYMIGHDLGRYIRNDARDAVKLSLGGSNSDMTCKAGHGQFKEWAAVPWIGIFDPNVTTGAQHGYYPVYLFSADMEKLYLSLNQGVHSVELEYKKTKIIDEELMSRARRMVARVAEETKQFPIQTIDLKSERSGAKRYCISHALGKVYDLASLPSEDTLQNDLLNMIKVYRKLTAMGGTGEIIGTGDDDQDNGKTFTEKRQYRYHRSIERNNAKLIAEVKRRHKKHCEGCEFDFGKTYGAFAEGYIEAHHLLPFADLPEDTEVPKDPMTDFAVLCANCHRMMHRKDGPKTIAKLKTILIASGS